MTTKKETQRPRTDAERTKLYRKKYRYIAPVAYQITLTRGRGLWHFVYEETAPRGAKKALKFTVERVNVMLKAALAPGSRVSVTVVKNGTTARIEGHMRFSEAANMIIGEFLPFSKLANVTLGELMVGSARAGVQMGTGPQLGTEEPKR